GIVADQQGSTQHFTVAGASAASTSTRTTDVALHMFEGRIDPSSSTSAKLFVDGVDVIPAGGNIGATTAAYNGITLGAGVRAGGTSMLTFAAVDIAEVAVYDHVVSTADIKQLRRWFRNKYALPVSL